MQQSLNYTDPYVSDFAILHNFARNRAHNKKIMTLCIADTDIINHIYPIQRGKFLTVLLVAHAVHYHAVLCQQLEHIRKHTSVMTYFNRK